MKLTTITMVALLASSCATEEPGAGGDEPGTNDDGSGGGGGDGAGPLIDLSQPPRPSACEVGTDVQKGEPSLPASSRVVPPSHPVFTFQVISDVHIHASDPRSFTNLNATLDDLRAIGPNAAALVITGDLTERGTAAELADLRALMNGRAHAPASYLIGNHEFHGTDPSSAEVSRYLAFAGVSRVWHERTVNGHPFLFLGGENGDGDPGKPAWTAMLSTAQLDWLDARLTALSHDSRPSFVFLHQPPSNSSNPTRLNQILAKHPNVVFFWGHWHRNLRESGLYDRNSGYLKVHAGAVQYLHAGSTNDYTLKNGLQVEVYANRILIRGRDFKARAWIPEFQETVWLEDNADANGTTRDFDGDGEADQVGQWLDGKLTAYYKGGQTNIGDGFQGLAQMVLTDSDADGRPDVVGIWPDGRLTVWLNGSSPGKPAFAERKELGATGWNAALRLTVTDFDGDGKEDLLAAFDSGKLVAYFNCGTAGKPSYCCSKEIGTGWQNIKRVRTLDADNDGFVDLIGQWPDGKLTAYLNRGDSTSPGFSGQKDIGTGWNQLTRVTVVDADADGKPDLLGRGKDGRLSAYLNTGTPGMPSFSNAMQVGTGWDQVTRVVVSGRDLIARAADGKLLRYANTGTPGKPAFGPAVEVGTGWHLIARVVVQ